MISHQGKFSVGDTVRVVFRIEKDAKTRSTPFEGTVISIRGGQDSKTFTVRKIATGKVAVEKIFPADSPHIEDVKVLSSRNVRRAKLFYLRNR
ncbi:50S ribosomal protein L19 [Candidatus Curtissbacteria bacterium]|nr:50S ribosomal protein L19 [Candidatus Curtissbacteria bacterium]